MTVKSKKHHGTEWTGKRILVSVVAALLALLMVLPMVAEIVVYGSAITQEDIDALKAEKSAIANEQAKAQKVLNDLKEQENSAMERLQALDTQIGLLSDQINAIYTKSIAVTVESANAVSDNLIGEMAGENEENTSVIDEAKAILGDLSGSVAGVIDQFRNVLNRFIEATAVMIVTTCLIPILVILFFVWIVKTLFNYPIILPTSLPKPKKKYHPYDTDPE